jgi:hypothetical protein
MEPQPLPPPQLQLFDAVGIDVQIVGRYGLDGVGERFRHDHSSALLLVAELRKLRHLTVAIV